MRASCVFPRSPIQCSSKQEGRTTLRHAIRQEGRKVAKTRQTRRNRRTITTTNRCALQPTKEWMNVIPTFTHWMNECDNNESAHITHFMSIINPWLINHFLFLLHVMNQESSLDHVTVEMLLDNKLEVEPSGEAIAELEQAGKYNSSDFLPHPKLKRQGKKHKRAKRYFLCAGLLQVLSSWTARTELNAVRRNYLWLMLSNKPLRKKNVTLLYLHLPNVSLWSAFLVVWHKDSEQIGIRVSYAPVQSSGHQKGWLCSKLF